MAWQADKPANKDDDGRKGQETRWRPEKYINGIKVMTGGREGLVAQPGAETGDKNK